MYAVEGTYLKKKTTLPFVDLFKRSNKSFYKKGFQRVVDKPAGLT